MSTTGARLAQRSKLASGTALAHLMALKDGLGTRFASEIRLTQEREEWLMNESAAPCGLFTVSLPAADDDATHATVFTAPAQQVVYQSTFTLWLTQQRHQDCFVYRL